MADNLTPKQRSYCMSRVRSRDTGLERLLRGLLHRRGFRFRKHVHSLPGRPDLVFARARLAVFIDGDFWHGYRFPVWRAGLSAFWIDKIERNRVRDRSVHRLLRRMGWDVLRIWQHQVQKDPEHCVRRITDLLTVRVHNETDEPE